MPEKVKFNAAKPHQIYRLADGAQVVGVTTALGIIAKPQLIHAAWKLGMEKKDYKKEWGKSALIGSIAHWLIECHLKGVEADTEGIAKDDLSKAQNALNKFLSWWGLQKLILVASEEQLVSEAHGYGGTLDILAQTEGGDILLIDIKSSKAIYPEMFYQLAAYRQLCAESPSKPAIKKVVIVRIGKGESPDDFEVQERADLGDDWQVFLAALKLYKRLKGEPKPEEKIEF
jgi:hypothetical protein